MNFNWFKKFSKFHKIYFIFFLIVNIFFFFSPLFTGGSLTSSLTLLAIAGLVSTITGLFAAVYTARAEAAAYAWGVANTIFYIGVSLSRHMYAEVILYTLYMLPMNTYGFFAWRKSAQAAKEKDSSSSAIEVRSLKKKQWIGIIFFVVIVWALYSQFVYHLPSIVHSLFGTTIPGDSAYLVDSFTATVTICAVIISTQRFKETWYFWILSDAVGILLYVHSLMSSPEFSLAALSGALMWVQFTVNAVYGLLVWKKIQRKEEAIEANLNN
ncbi:nicotinamide riboside transporter PnuC [uncultured Clostridium sp.]|uniref:nicotinamide riboside transporter PnuC n=1 Tax=uncultured Clostridium sp. TaxID=59620 RepID=UPI0026137D13|nr:nicotinamide riboside transporter PnuC [uncultured Clostridium sp.]